MTRMSFLEHLEELRTRIIQTLIGLAVAYALCLLLATQLFGWMTEPVKRAFVMLQAVCEFDAPLKLVAITPFRTIQSNLSEGAIVSGSLRLLAVARLSGLEFYRTGPLPA